jgi:hypothetical protein
MKIRYPHPVSKDWALWEWSDIPSKVKPEEVYLRRLRLLQTPWCALYVHWIYEADFDRDPHDHPWNFWSFVLRGGYVEHIYDSPDAFAQPKWWRRFSLHKMPSSAAHQIRSVVKDTVTFVVTGRRTRTWGFWTKAGFVPWTTYLGMDQASEDSAPEA